MPLPPGTRLGVYTVVEAIGAGGMGEVYRARDTSLDRDVAIKVLPEVFAADQERAARFAREAKTLAALNHQNIAHIHGVVDLPADAGRHMALVMEYVDGEDLAQVLQRGPIPLDEALPVARQVADALECAHEQGIVHRDLKPANIKLRPDGVVKVLDFGLAKALGAPEGGGTSSSALMLSPTFTSPAMTQMGIILGTAAYMAPEQARGKAVDKRADVWAFGVVLFEMLSGTRAFEGSEVSDTLAFVLTKEPDWKALPAATPPAIRRLLERCLQKDRKQRLADISDARLELDEGLKPQAPVAVAAAPARNKWIVPGVAAASLIAGVLIGVPAARTWFTPAPPPPPVVRFAITLAEGQAFTNTGRHFLAISPTGSHVIYTADSQLYLRPLGSTTAQPIAGSAMAAGVINPTFSPDGQSVAFFSEGGLYKLPVTGGAPFRLASDFLNPLGMTWVPGWILAGQAQVGIVRVPEAGGKPEVLVAAEPGTSVHGPQLLSDGDTLIFTVYTGGGANRFDKGKVFAYSLRSKQRKLLFDGGADGRVLPTGHLVYGNAGVLYAVTFDARTQTVSGTPTPILQGVRRGIPTGALQYRVADNGTLIYVAGSVGDSTAPRSLGWIDKTGKASPLAVPANSYDAPRLSPDGRRLAVGITTETEADIWIQDLPITTAMRRLTFGGRNRFAVWSPDGRQVAFQSDRDGHQSIYVQDADLSGGAARLLIKGEPSLLLNPASWSRDGWMAVGVGKEGQTAVHVAHVKDPKLTLFTPLPPNTQTLGGTFSPDGRWLAYFTASSLAPGHVYIEPFPATGAKYQITDGVTPFWNPRTSELLVGLRNGGVAIFKVNTAPTVSFSRVGEIDRRDLPAVNSQGARAVDFAPDGTRLVALLPASIEEMRVRDINVVLNWFQELKK